MMAGREGQRALQPVQALGRIRLGRPLDEAQDVTGRRRAMRADHDLHVAPLARMHFDAPLAVAIPHPTQRGIDAGIELAVQGRERRGGEGMTGRIIGEPAQREPLDLDMHPRLALQRARLGVGGVLVPHGRHDAGGGGVVPLDAVGVVAVADVQQVGHGVAHVGVQQAGQGGVLPLKLTGELEQRRAAVVGKEGLELGGVHAPILLIILLMSIML